MPDLMRALLHVLPPSLRQSIATEMPASNYVATRATVLLRALGLSG
jgi:hypothetical protein